MIIYHTTFHLSDEIYPEGLDCLKAIYIPAATCGSVLHSPKIQRILNEENEDGGDLSVQFPVADTTLPDDRMNKKPFAADDDGKVSGSDRRRMEEREI